MNKLSDASFVRANCNSCEVIAMLESEMLSRAPSLLLFLYLNPQQHLRQAVDFFRCFAKTFSVIHAEKDFINTSFSFAASGSYSSHTFSSVSFTTITIWNRNDWCNCIFPVLVWPISFVQENNLELVLILASVKKLCGILTTQPLSFQHLYRHLIII